MRGGERNACSGLELSIPCGELFQCGGCHRHLFPSSLSHHTLPCPSNVSRLFRTPGRFLFCMGVLPQGTVFRLHRISCVEMGWEMHRDSPSGSCAPNQTWGTWSQGLLCPRPPLPTLAPQHWGRMGPFSFATP